MAHSRMTAQGQVSVPATVRRRLGIGPGAILEWEEGEDGTVIVRRSGRHSLEDLHRALFPDGPPAPRTLEEIEEGIRGSARRRHARR